MSPGDYVMIVGGISDMEHGVLDTIDTTTYTRPFAMVNLYNRDGSLSTRQTLVPLSHLKSFGRKLDLGGKATKARIKEWIEGKL